MESVRDGKKDASGKRAGERAVKAVRALAVELGATTIAMRCRTSL